MHKNSRVGSLTVVGLGPGSWESLTMEAATVLQEAKHIYVRTTTQPALDAILAHLPDISVSSFDWLYESLSDLETVYEQISQELGRRVEEGEDVVYAVPGSPSVGETSVRLVRMRLEDAGADIRLVQGMSFVEPVLGAVGATDVGWLEVIDASDIVLLASENAVGEVEEGDGALPWRAPVPTAPLLVSQLYDQRTASAVKLWLGRFYPDEHLVNLVHGIDTPDPRVETVPLYMLDRGLRIDHTTALHVPRLDENDNVRTFAGLMQLTRRLRGPGGCPWDREQTHASLKPHLLEETYEVLDALDSNDAAHMAEEFGDLLFQVTLHSQVAAEAGEFTIEDVIEHLMRKLIGRHPHVFGDLELPNAQDVRQHWETFKQKEKPKRSSVLEQIPRGLPALPQSNLMQKRAASVGFEWPSLAAVLDKVREELLELEAEVEAGSPKEEQREEFGDILFALVSVARHLKLDPEEALRMANRKFAARFQYVESRATAVDKSLRDLSPQELDAFWEEAKALGTARHADATADA